MASLVPSWLLVPAMTPIMALLRAGARRILRAFALKQEGFARVVRLLTQSLKIITIAALTLMAFNTFKTQAYGIFLSCIEYKTSYQALAAHIDVEYTAKFAEVKCLFTLIRQNSFMYNHSPPGKAYRVFLRHRHILRNCIKSLVVIGIFRTKGSTNSVTWHPL